MTKVFLVSCLQKKRMHGQIHVCVHIILLHVRVGPVHVLNQVGVFLPTCQAYSCQLARHFPARHIPANQFFKRIMVPKLEPKAKKKSLNPLILMTKYYLFYTCAMDFLEIRFNTKPNSTCMGSLTIFKFKLLLQKSCIYKKCTWPCMKWCTKNLAGVVIVVQSKIFRRQSVMRNQAQNKVN